MGARSAGNPHAACDVEGTGNVVWVGTPGHTGAPALDPTTAGNTGASTPVVFTLDTVPPTVAISTAGGVTNQATHAISGTVAATEAAVGATVTLYDNGSTTPLGTATVGSGGGWRTTGTLSGDGPHTTLGSGTQSAWQ